MQRTTSSIVLIAKNTEADCFEISTPQRARFCEIRSDGAVVDAPAVDKRTVKMMPSSCA